MLTARNNRFDNGPDKSFYTHWADFAPTGAP